VELDIQRGWCTHTLTAREFHVDSENYYVTPDGERYSWWQMRPLMIHVPYQSWVEIKKYIIAECRRNKRCGEKVSSWDRTIESIDKAILQK
jgi:hypothetical protein